MLHRREYRTVIAIIWRYGKRHADRMSGYACRKKHFINFSREYKSDVGILLRIPRGMAVATVFREFAILAKQ